MLTVRPHPWAIFRTLSLILAALACCAELRAEDQAPSITSVLTAPAKVGVAFNYSLSASGMPTPTLSFTNVPNGFTVAPNGTDLSGTFTSAGTVVISLHAVNRAGADDKDLVITVNQTPVITSTPFNKTAITGLPFTYTLTATGTPTPALTFTGVPANIVVNGATLSGSFANAGIQTIGLQAVNAGGPDNQTLTVDVAQQMPPAITSATAVTVLVGAPFSYTMTESGVPAADILQFANVPAGLTVNGATISGTFSTAGVRTINLHTHSVGTPPTNVDDKVLTVTVNEPPLITSDLSAGATVDLPFSYTLTATGTPAPVLSFAMPLPSGITATGATLSGTFTSTGVQTIGLIASNSVNTDTRTLFVNVSAQASPAITSAISDSAIAGIPYGYTLSATGSPPPSVSFTTVPAGMSVMGLNNETIFGTIASAGVYTIGLHAMNGVNNGSLNHDDKILTLTVSSQAPVSITSGLTRESVIGTTFSYTLTATGNPAPVVSIPNPPAGLSIVAGPTPDTLTLQGAFATAGTFNINLHAQSGANAVANADDKVLTVVAGPEAPPLISSPLSDTAVMGIPYSYTLTAGGFPSADSLTFTNVPSAPDATLNVNGAVLSGTFNTTGIFMIGLHSHNPDLNVTPTDDQVLRVTVVPQQPAHIEPPLALNAVKGEAFVYTLMATGQPAPQLSYTLADIPGGFTVSGATILGTFGATGTVAIGVHATSPAGDDNQQLVITVNDKPKITSALAQTIPKGAAFNYTLTATGTPAPALEFVGTLPAGIVANGAMLSGAFTNGGVQTIALRATNTADVDNKDLVVTVLEAPSITSSLAVNATVGTVFNYQLTATGTPAPALSFVNAPAGFTTSGGMLSGTFTATGPVTVGLHADNGIGTADDKNLVITVNETPVITSALALEAITGLPFSYTLTATGTPAPTLSFTGALPSGISATGATLSGAFTNAGIQTIGLKASNVAGDDIDTLTINVVAAQSPLITSDLTATVIQGFPFSYTLTAGGVPAADSLTFANYPTPDLSVSGASGEVLSGSFSLPGIYSIHLHTHNAATDVPNTDDKVLTVTVLEQFPATIDSPLAVKAVLGEPFSYTLTATGFPVPHVAYDPNDIPAGFVITGATLSGIFSTVGTLVINVQAVNPSHIDRELLVITINQKPAITSALTAEAIARVPFSYTLTATGTPPPSFSFGNVPLGLQANGDTLSGTFIAAGQYSISLNASNIAGSASETLVVNVVEPTPPAITSALTANVVAGEPFSYTLTATGNPAASLSFDTVPGDPDASLTLSGATLSGVFNTPGQYAIGLHALNPGGSQDKSLIVTVQPRAVPKITSALAVNVKLNQPFLYTLTGSGVPAPSLSFTEVPPGFLVNGATLGGVFTSAGQFSIGLHAVTGADSDNQTLVVTVIEAPKITSALSATALIGANFSYTLVATGSPAPALTFTDIPAGFQNANGTFSGSFTLTGTYSIGLHASNSAGNDSRILTVTVGQVPAITSPLSDSIIAGADFNYLLTATGAPFPTLSFLNVPAGLTTNGPALSGKVIKPGIYSIGLHAENGIGIVDGTLLLVVGSAPKILSPLTASATAGDPFTYTLSASGVPAPAYSFGKLPQGFSSKNGVLEGTFASDGVFNLELRAENAFGLDTQTLAVSVGVKPIPPVKPVITSALSASTIAGAAFTYTLSASGTGPVALAVDGMPSTLSFNGSTISGAFPLFGTYSLTLFATNAAGNDKQILTVTVGTATEGVSATWGGSVKGKTFSQSSGAAASKTLNATILVALSQSGDNLAAEVTIGNRVYHVKGKMGGETLWLSGSDEARQNTLTLSGHLQKKGTGLKGQGVVRARDGADEFTYSVVKR